MRTWNYRIFHDRIDDEEYFWIGEAYYDDAGQVAVHSDAKAPQGESRFTLGEDLGLMARAFSMPVLDADASESITPDNVDEVIAVRMTSPALTLP